MVSGLNWQFCQWKMCANIALVNERYCVDHLEQSAVKSANRRRPQHTLTVKQQQMLDWILDFMRNRGLSPTIREITDGLHISSTSVTAYYLDRLEAKGTIQRDRFVSRGIHFITTEAIDVPNAA